MFVCNLSQQDQGACLLQIAAPVPKKGVLEFFPLFFLNHYENILHIQHSHIKVKDYLLVSQVGLH